MSRRVGTKSERAKAKAWIRPRLRVMHGEEIALGPGRVDLLELIGATGSLRKAAKRMGISYMRAWNLVKFSNRSFAEPLVHALRGGSKGGGAELTAAGKRIVNLYRRMEKQSQSAVKQPWSELKKYLKR